MFKHEVSKQNPVWFVACCAHDCHAQFAGPYPQREDAEADIIFANNVENGCGNAHFYRRVTSIADFPHSDRIMGTIKSVLRDRYGEAHNDVWRWATNLEEERVKYERELALSSR
jgi:hypothetical protein